MDQVDEKPEEPHRFRAVILVVDDDPFLQKLACKQLERLNYQTLVAGSGYETLQYLEKRLHFDLILMDCHMPGMDGFYLTEQIRAMDYYRDIPIIAMTASVIEGTEVFTSAGMNDCLGKPFAMHELSAMLEYWLFQKTQSAQHFEGTEAVDAITVANSDFSPDTLQNQTSATNKQDLEQRQASGSPFFDMGKLEKVFGKEGSLEIIRTFVQSNSTILEEMQKARTELQQDRVKSLSHRLKGAASMACIRELSQTSALLEAAGAKAEWTEIDRLLDRLGMLLRQANDEFNTVLYDKNNGPRC